MPWIPLPLLLLLMMLLAGGCWSSPARAGALAQPNIVLVLTDDMRRDDLEHMPLTQSLLVDRGTTFSSFIANVPLCCPARATILRGQYSHNTGILTNEVAGAFDKFYRSGHEKQTIATALQAAGYATGHFGKYLNGYPGKLGWHVPPGWSEWAAPIAGNAYRGFNYALLERILLPSVPEPLYFGVYYGRAPEDYATDVLVAKTRDFIVESVGAQMPFFAFLSVFMPHNPARPAPRHEHLFREIGLPRRPSFDEADVSDKPAYMRRLKPLSAATERKLDRLHRRRVLSLQAVDEGVASLVSLLDDLGQLESTYIFFTSDNGFHLGEHRMKPGKRSPYEEDIALPLAVRGPGVLRGARVEALAGNTDLAPTFAAIAGSELPYDPDGRSLLPWLSDPRGTEAWRQAFLIDLWAGTNKANGKMRVPAYHGLRTPRHVYVEYATGERELYDLGRDPNQLDNAIGSAAPDLLEGLARRLAALRDCRGQTCRDLEDRPLTTP